jgi:hypothetical protein
MTLPTLRSVAIRNDRFKLVTNSFAGDPSPDAGAPEPPSCDAEMSEEFYAIDESAPLPRIDREGFDLLKLPGLTPEQHANYLELSAELLNILSS